MRHSLEKGIQNYLVSAKWKRTIDIWQYKLQCCGVDDYNDWYQLSWMDKYHIDINNRISQSLRLSQEKLHFPVVPWSCCRIKFPMQCLHDPLQQAQSAHLWKEQPKLVVESINTDGCLNKLRAPIRLSMIGFLIICIFLIILQLAIIIVSRLLYTSAKNAIILRDPEGESPGYLLTRGCTGQAKKTVSELVLTIQSSKDKTYDFEEKPSVKKSGLSKFISKPSIPKMSPKRLKKKRKDKHKGHDSNEDPVSTEDEEALMLR
ncbi:tetraspanin ec2 domain superfamily [Holotrichia oblita]|uniref:Tetraspanin ec2 domain superfamily n=1 Tax=Holotrichia oblita TaxID=644536 RepID=A0ACB9T3R4_HOLOL|nr:tetraspanin ec2 domain superfamily [Holotrichia oblita]